MDRTIDMTSARALVASEFLWPRVRAFLWDFAPQIHSSRMDEEKAKSADGAFARATEMMRDASHAVSIRAKRFILNTFGVEPVFHDFPKEDGSRLALLDSNTLEKIAKWIGAIVCEKWLRKITSAKEVRAYKEALPGIYPEVFGYTMYFGAKAEEENKAASQEELEVSGPEDVIFIGYSLLGEKVSKLSAPLVKRFWLKLPNFCTGAEAEKRRAKIVKAAHKTINLELLMRLLLPEACRVCYS